MNDIVKRVRAKRRGNRERGFAVGFTLENLEGFKF